MSYINANVILPKELITEIQKYVQGVNLYIPKNSKERKIDSCYRDELAKRNREIYELFRTGSKVSDLAKKYFLSEKSIYRILGEFKK